jgi:WD40 repeat protein
MNFERELYSLIAKLLQGRFPETHRQFLTEQESLARQVPPSILSKHPAIRQLAFTHGLPLDEFVQVISAMRSQPVDAHHDPPQSRRSNYSLSVADALSFDLALPQIISKPLPAQNEIWAHLDQICCLACDVTSQILISGADDHDVKLWRLPSGTEIAHLEVHSGPLTNVAVHPSNRFFMTSSLDGHVKMFSLPECNELADSFTGPKCFLANFSRTGKYLLTAHSDAVLLRTVNNETGEISSERVFRWEVPKHDALEALDFSPGDEFLACSTCHRILQILSLETKAYFVMPGRAVWDVVVFAHRSATLLLTVASSMDLCVLRYSREQMFDSEVVLKAEDSGKLWRAQFTCDDSRIVAVAEHLVAIFATQTHCLIATIPQGQWYDTGWNVLPHPRIPTLCAILCADGRACLWDIERRQLVQALECTTGNLATDAVWTLDGESLIIGENTGRLVIFGQGGRESSLIRLATKMRTDFPYERHLHAFFAVPHEAKTQRRSRLQAEIKKTATSRVYMNPPEG